MLNEEYNKDKPYDLAPEVEVIGKVLVEQFHPHLKNAKIAYVFKDKAQRYGDGRTVLGRAGRRSKLDQLLSEKGEDFAIIISKDRWQKMNDSEKKALVDHELCHCGIAIDAQGQSKFALRGHPIEEFPENLGRFEHRRARLGNLIKDPPSAISIKQQTRLIESEEESKLNPKKEEE